MQRFIEEASKGASSRSDLHTAVLVAWVFSSYLALYLLCHQFVGRLARLVWKRHEMVSILPDHVLRNSSELTAAIELQVQAV